MPNKILQSRSFRQLLDTAHVVEQEQMHRRCLRRLEQHSQHRIVTFKPLGPVADFGLRHIADDHEVFCLRLKPFGVGRTCGKCHCHGRAYSQPANCTDYDRPLRIAPDPDRSC